MKQLTWEWLNSAEEDLLAIKNLLHDPVLTNIVAFHAQQAIEKSLKAVVEEFGLEFKKTHNIETLLIRIEGVLALNIDEIIIAELDRLYLDSRYPGSLGFLPKGKPTTEEASDYFKEALKIKQQLEDFLEGLPD